MFKILVCFLFSALAFAEPPRKIGMIIGGGKGDRDPMNPVFMNQGDGFASNLSKKGYEIRGAFGTTQFTEQMYLHDRSQDYLDAWSNGKFKPATAQSIDEQLNWILDEIENGKIKKDDQVVIQLSTHGNPVTIDEIAHSIFIPSVDSDEDSDAAPKDQVIHLSDKLNGVIQKLNDVGAKTALLDFSCFSGGSLDLAKNRSKNVCVVSATNRYTPAKAVKEGYEDAGAYFWNNVQSADQNKTSAKDVESIFLSARRMNSFTDVPEISSEEHQRIRPMWDLLFAKYAAEGMGSNRVGHVAPILECSELGVKLPFQDYELFQSLLSSTLKSDKDMEELSTIAQRIMRLAEIRDESGAYLYKKFKVNESEIDFGTCRGFYNDNSGAVQPLDSILAPIYETIESVKVSNYYEDSPKRRADRIQEEHERIKERTLVYGQCTTDELKTFMSPLVGKHASIEKEYLKLSEEQTRLERKFREKEREVYEKLYLEFSKDSKTSNACRDFVF